jgi:hypothetical protein
VTVTIIATLIGDDTAQAGEIVCRGRSPVFALCRALLASGAPPESRLECYRGMTLALVVKSIGPGAKLTIEERDRGGIKIFRWRPISYDEVGPSMGRNGETVADLASAPNVLPAVADRAATA